MIWLHEQDIQTAEDFLRLDAREIDGYEYYVVCLLNEDSIWQNMSDPLPFEQAMEELQALIYLNCEEIETIIEEPQPTRSIFSSITHSLLSLVL